MLEPDIRMQIVNINDIKIFVNNLEGKWVYVKYLVSDISEGRTGLYSKMRILNVDTYSDTEWILYGEEDDDRVVISLTTATQYEMTSQCDEILIRNPEMTMYIRLFNPKPWRIQDIPSLQKNLIITEGKTDWKLFKAALRYFHRCGKYKDLDISFLEYEDELNAGNEKMLRVMEYNSVFPNDKIRLFIFDNDTPSVNEHFDNNCQYKNEGNNVYSMLLPVPEFRKDAPLISIENLFKDEDITRKDENGRRLYLQSEFGADGRLKNNPNIITLNSSDNPNHIIDDKVYEIPDMTISKTELFKYVKSHGIKNIALSKNDFSKKVLLSESGFEKLDFSAFEEVFDIIENVYCDYHNNRCGERVVGRGISIKAGDNGFAYMYIRGVCSSESIEQIKRTESVTSEIVWDETKSKLELSLIFPYMDSSYGLKIPIEINLDTIEFLHNKVENDNNRIIVSIMAEGNEPQDGITFEFEVLKGPIGSALIERLF